MSVRLETAEDLTIVLYVQSSVFVISAV